jgi:two-component system sensor histidine kinase YesM
MKIVLGKSKDIQQKKDYEQGSQSLRMKIFLFDLAVVLAALLLFCGIFLNVTTSRLEKETKQSAQAALDQAGLMLEEQAQAFRNSADTLSLDEANVELLNQNNAERYRSVFNWNQDYVLLTKRISNLLFRSNISDVKIVTDNAISAYNSESVIPFDHVKKTKWYKQVSTSQSACTWSKYSSLFPGEGDDKMILFTRNLPYEYSNYQTFYVGCVKKEDFNGLLSAGTADEYTSYYVLNSSNEILLSSKTSAAQEDVNAIFDWVQEGYRKSEQPIQVQPVQVRGHQYFAGSWPIQNTDLKLVCSCAFYAKKGDSIRKNILSMNLITIAVLPLILLFSMLVSRSVTHPLEKLRENMMAVSEGNFNVPIVPPSSDREVRALTRCFNYMLLKISDLLEQQYNYGKRIKELEIRSLQAQINPHFLYNTLDLIKWKAIKYKDSDVQNLVMALSEYYRKGLSKGADFVTLQSEIAHITSYVYIQNMRFDDCVRMRCVVDEKASRCLLPKLTLQPLVENAITHGILESESGKGNVLVRTFLQGDILYIAIVDDGCGMPPEKAANIFEWTKSNPVTGSGYGLRNINERIRLSFGENYGLSFISYPERGTAAVLKIPYRTNEEERNV